MVCITGDVHGEYDRFLRNDIKSLKKNDSIIICGDFGFIWSGDKKEEQILQKIGTRKHNTYFIDGVHENFELLNSYPIVDFHGGKAQIISGKLVHLMRGEIYTFEGKTFLCFGGGTSPDKELRQANQMWWEEETPTLSEMENATKNLKKYGNKVDYVLTFETTSRLKKILSMNFDGSGGYDITPLNTFFEHMRENITYDHWFFGCHHTDKNLTPYQTCVYNDMLILKTK